MSSNCVVMPNNEKARAFLDREGYKMELNYVSELPFSSINKQHLPVCLTIGEKGQEYAYILYDEGLFNKYRNQALTTEFKRFYYSVDIDRLFKVSNLGEFKHYISPDRIHSKTITTRGKKHIVREEELMVIAKELNRTKTPTELAKQLNLKTSQIMHHARVLVERGVNIPLRAKHLQYDRLIEQLKQTNPDLISEPKKPVELKVANGHANGNGVRKTKVSSKR